ncbi:MAG: Rap1a/Tai family immunity protein [Paraglaciecola sp.]|uniref:Rap1a/Tai family immunity protein n=1 Tax=Paraglaciecola sp. TaxID=1920173 RepID=UPI0032987164
MKYFLVILFLLLTSQVGAKERKNDAGQLQLDCAEYLKAGDDASKNALNAMACQEFIQGIISTKTYYSLFYQIDKGFCLPKMVNPTEVATAINSYILSKPLNRGLMKGAIAMRALEQSYPCKK